MALAERDVRIRFIIDDQTSVPIKKINFGIKQLGDGLTKLGRNMVFTGFVLNAATRRITRQFKNLFNIFKNLVKEGADTQRAITWLGDTLESLAVAGLLTGDKITEATSTFQTMLQNSFDLRGELARLDMKFQATKNVIVEELIAALRGMNESFDLIDWETLNESIRQAMENLLDPILRTIERIIGEEGLGAFGSKLEAIATMIGKFAAGMVSGFNDVLTVVAALIGEDTAGGGGLGGLSFTFGSLTAKLALISVPLILFGGILGTVGKVVTVLAGAIGGPGALALGVVIAAVIIDFENWISTIGDALNAIRDLLNLLDIEFPDVMKEVKEGISDFTDWLLKPVRELTNFINLLNQAIRLAQSLMGGGGYFGGGARGMGTSYTTNMGGTTININGARDPYAIAREVSRIQGRQVRSTLVLT